MDNCTLLVNSYDGGEDLWDGFFTALKHEWKDFDMPIVLNTESKRYSFEGLNIRTFHFYEPGQNVPWAKRLIRTLRAIETDYILFFLEDFWLEDKVDTLFLEKSFQWLKDNPDVAVLSYKPVSGYGPNIRDDRFERFEKRPQEGKYRFNCQAAIWRRERLIKFLRSHESPWEWEILGSIRSSRYKDGFYTLIEGAQEVFPYDMGWVVYRGRWCKRAVMPLAEKYNLNIDFSRRGFYEEQCEQTKVQTAESKAEKMTVKVFFRKVKTAIKITHKKFHKLRSVI